VDVDLQANLCTVTPAQDRVPVLAGVPEAVRAAGYRPARMWLRARGGAQQRDGATWFTVAGTSLALRVDGAIAADGILVGQLSPGEPWTVVPGPPPR
jgi:hypothetical protein